MNLLNIVFVIQREKHDVPALLDALRVFSDVVVYEEVCTIGRNDRCSIYHIL